VGGGELRLNGQQVPQTQLAPDIGNVDMDHTISSSLLVSGFMLPQMSDKGKKKDGEIARTM
jgi:hypothetical protein